MVLEWKPDKKFVAFEESNEKTKKEASKETSNNTVEKVEKNQNTTKIKISTRSHKRRIRQQGTIMAAIIGSPRSSVPCLSSRIWCLIVLVTNKPKSTSVQKKDWRVMFRFTARMDRISVFLWRICHFLKFCLQKLKMMSLEILMFKKTWTRGSMIRE